MLLQDLHPSGAVQHFPHMQGCLETLGLEGLPQLEWRCNLYNIIKKGTTAISGTLQAATVRENMGSWRGYWG